jgi:hypothetical protein
VTRGDDVSIQRRRGVEVKVYRSVERVDARGNHQLVVDLNNPVTVRAAAIPQRSARAEVPGQMAIEVVRLIVDVDVDADLWSRVEYAGGMWDIAAPAAVHNGSRHSRHKSVDIRRRPG